MEESDITGIKKKLVEVEIRLRLLDKIAHAIEESKGKGKHPDIIYVDKDSIFINDTEVLGLKVKVSPFIEKYSMIVMEEKLIPGEFHKFWTGNLLDRLKEAGVELESGGK
jgi:hypothetical protein